MEYKVFREKVSDCINVFDLMALIYKYLLELNDDKRCDITNLDDDVIIKIVNDYNQNNCHDHIHSILDLETKILKLNNEKMTPNMMYNLLNYLDLSVDIELEIPLHSGSVRNCTFLNFNCEDIGIFICRNSKFNVLNDTGIINKFRNEIGSNTHNFYDSDNVIFLKKEELFDFKLNIWALKKSNTISKNVHHNHTLSVALSPFVCNHYKDFLKSAENAFYFWFENAQGYGMEDEYANRYFSILDKALRSDAQIIMFPEIILTEKICERLSGHIKKANIVDNKIIIAGTISRNGDNCCIVYDNFGKDLFVQYKKTPFDLKTEDGKKLREKLNTNNDIHVLDIEHLGRIFIFICKDLNNANLNYLLTSLKGNFLFVPAYSPSNDIMSKGKSISFEQLCFVFVINSCSAFNKNNDSCDKFVRDNISYSKDIGAIIMPAIKEKSMRDKKVVRLSLDKSCQACKDTCSPYFTTIKFNKIEEINDLRTCQIIKQRI